MTQLRLTYFDAPGRAEPVRIALFLAGVAFEDRRLNYPSFAALKEQGAFPLGSVPVLEVDGQDLFWWGGRTRAARRRLHAVVASAAAAAGLSAG